MSKTCIHNCLRVFGLTAITAFAASRPAHAQKLTVDLMTGSAYNAPTPLTIRQDGFPDIHMTAHYRTRPFSPFAPYYSWRVEVWNADHTAAWEVQQVHHRLFLKNTTAEVERFEIHYGYNFFLVGRAWASHGFVLHASGGVIAPNPASRIRGKSLNTLEPGALDVSYHVSGVGVGLAISRAAAIGKHLALIADGAMLGGRASVLVRDGDATVPNLGFHGHLGLQFKF